MNLDVALFKYSTYLEFSDAVSCGCPSASHEFGAFVGAKGGWNQLVRDACHAAVAKARRPAGKDFLAFLKGNCVQPVDELDRRFGADNSNDGWVGRDGVTFC
ncbi:MAG TPA: hypothetical protein VGP63_30905 [Planctomycetaceae bacterium]|nr:hypothetical protein [Planctomycetaceae bacterium]